MSNDLGTQRQRHSKKMSKNLDPAGHLPDLQSPAVVPGLRFFRSEEHTSELQSHLNLVCRLLLEKKKKNQLVVFDKREEAVVKLGALGAGAVSSAKEIADWTECVLRSLRSLLRTIHVAAGGGVPI